MKAAPSPERKTTRFIFGPAQVGLGGFFGAMLVWVRSSVGAPGTYFVLAVVIALAGALLMRYNPWWKVAPEIRIGMALTHVLTWVWAGVAAELIAVALRSR